MDKDTTDCWGTQRMVRDAMDGQGCDGWLRIQLTGIQNMFFIIQMFKAFCYGCSNLRMTHKSKELPTHPKEFPEFTPSDPKKGHKRSKITQKALLRAGLKKYYKWVSKSTNSQQTRCAWQAFYVFVAARVPCDVFDPWARWERGQVGI